MIKVAVYNRSTGKITAMISGAPNQIDIQCGEDEDFFLNCPLGATHILEGIPSTMEPFNLTLVQRFTSN